MVAAGFGQRLKPMADVYIEAAGIDATAAEPPRTIRGFPRSPARG